MAPSPQLPRGRLCTPACMHRRPRGPLRGGCRNPRGLARRPTRAPPPAWGRRGSSDWPNTEHGSRTCSATNPRRPRGAPSRSRARREIAPPAPCRRRRRGNPTCRQCRRRSSGPPPRQSRRCQRRHARGAPNPAPARGSAHRAQKAGPIDAEPPQSTRCPSCRKRRRRIADLRPAALPRASAAAGPPGQPRALLVLPAAEAERKRTRRARPR
mmetsp:Transcript_80045/g.231281  ORF Transcript_80045/g.231281 Transcript_80045/m.231281 type:complete len:212 (+) Transcript_80045:128-763(+)